MRIIGGNWRGRKLDFESVAGLRPTGDRIRETLFNWVSPVIKGSRCLDLFAGSGALGFEAASRGAAAVVLVERERLVARKLRQHIATLEADELIGLEQIDALDYLSRPGEPFDLVFLDPPFGKALVAPCLQSLHEGSWLRPRAHIYLELERGQAVPPLPEGWDLSRSKTTGQVAYHLISISD